MATPYRGTMPAPSARPGVPTGLGAVAAVSLLLIPVPGIMAAIAIPSLVRADVSANERASVDRIRSVISAEAGYQLANEGWYDKLDCLVTPQKCIPGYDGPRFLDAKATGETGNGYRFTFVPGPAATVDPAVASASSLTSFALLAEPEKRDETGVRSFCGDSTGRMCSTTGTPIHAEDGACPADCPALR
jgi:hypothetical protein